MTAGAAGAVGGDEVAAFGARGAAAFPVDFGARAESVRALDARAFGSVPAFAVVFPFAAAAGFFRLVVPDFVGRAAALGPAEFFAGAFREEEPFAGDFLAVAGFSAAASSVTRAAAASAAAFLPRVRVLDGSAIFPVVATVVSEGVGAHERRRGK